MSSDVLVGRRPCPTPFLCLAGITFNSELKIFGRLCEHNVVEVDIRFDSRDRIDIPRQRQLKLLANRLLPHRNIGKQPQRKQKRQQLPWSD